MKSDSRLLELRTWPFPYLAGITFSNDVDAMDFDFFDEFMKFLNSKSETKFGVGLGLEITSSTFFFSPKTNSVSVFTGLESNSEESLNAPRLVEYIKAGWIDTIHAYGDFDSFPVFTRDHSLRVFEFLGKLRTKIHVFSNHGSIDNIQNLGKDAAYHQGDQPSSHAYHSDICHKNGVEFLWTDSMTYHNPAKANLRDMIVSKIRSVTTLRSHPRYFDARDNVEIKAVRLVDNNAFIGFRRFGGVATSPNLSLVQDQIDRLDFSMMYRKKKGAVIYQHFGVVFQDLVECRSATIQEVIERRIDLLAPFELIKKESIEGRLWVIGCYRFLKYLVMRDSIEIIKLSDGNFQAKTIKSNAMDAIENCDLSGLTFYSDQPGPAKLFVGNQSIVLTKNPIDETGKGSFSIPIKPLTQIW